MEAIISPIRPFERGANVANLQQALILLGFPISPDDLKDAFFGEATNAALRRFQTSQHIEGTGIVDDRTAEAINQILRKKGLINTQFRVSGGVFDILGTAISQKQVAVFDVDLRGVPLLDKIRSLAEMSQTAGFQLLGIADTSTEGGYSLGFNTDQFIAADKSHADVVAYLVQDRELLVQRSRLATKRDYTANNEVQNLDIRLQNTEILRGASDWELLNKAITPILEASRLSLFDIRNSEEQILFLAQEADIDELQLRTAAQAAGIILGRTEFAANALEMVYALGRMQVGLTHVQINDFTDAQLFERLKSAINFNIISFKTDEDLKGFVKRLLSVTATEILNPNNTTSSVQVLNRALQSAALTTPATKVAFLKATQTYDGVDPAKFWTQNLPQAGLNTTQINALKLTNQLYALTSGHAPLIENLQIQRGLKTPTALLSLTENEWLDIVRTTGVPEGFDNAAEYVADIRNNLHAAYPTQKVADMIRKKELPAASNFQKPLLRFFEKASDFDFTSKRIEDFENIIQAVAPEQANGVRLSLQTMQRVFQISPTPAAMSQLMSSGITSAFQVAGVPEAAFVQQFSKTLGSESAALSVHNRASHVVARALDTVMTTNELTHLAMPVATAMNKNVALDAIKKHIPNYENIFGKADICECRDCRSVNSPAAYLVDTLLFLDKLAPNKADATGKTPLQVLESRRPDLLHLPLTCENTNTIIPYIDLVNEVLEYYIAHNNMLDAKAANDTGTTTASDLRATPQFLSLDAYKKLADAVYPFSLPYHQPLDTLRSFLPEKVKRPILMELFGIKNAASVAENLNLSPRDYQIITGQDFDGNPSAIDLWMCYGFPDEPTMNMQMLMPLVPDVQNRTGLAYIDLVSLIKTRFLNPAQPTFDFIEDIFKKSNLTGQQIYQILRDVSTDALNPDDNADVKSALDKRGITAEAFTTWTKANFESLKTLVLLFEPESLCQLSTTRLATIEQIYEAAVTPLSADFLSKMHRFIRLWRRLGWTVEGFDTVLHALQATDFTPSVVAQLAAIKQLAETTKLPLDQLATLFGSIETTGEKPLFSKLLQSKAIQQVDLAFMPDAFGNILTANTPIGNHISALLAAFKIKKEEFTDVLADVGLTDGDTLTLQNISTIYRYAVLSKSLKLKVDEFLIIKKILGISPFSTLNAGIFTDVDAERSLSFIKQAEILKGADFKIKELDYVLTGTGVSLTDAQVQKTIENILADWSKTDENALRENSVNLQIGIALGVSEAQMSEILRGTITDIPTNRTLLADIMTILNTPADRLNQLGLVLRPLHRGAVLIQKANLSIADLNFILKNKIDFDNIDFRNPTLAAWRTINDWVQLRKTPFNTDWLPVLEEAHNPAATIDGVLAKVFENITPKTEGVWPVENLRFTIQNHLGFGVADLQKTSNWAIIATICQLATDTGFTVERLKSWAVAETDFDKIHALAVDVQNAIRAKYDDTTWADFAPTINNMLRERRRDALVTYLLVQQPLINWGVTDADSLFEYFLIDVQMGSCMDTSRVRQAMSSVQLFVTRCLLNLEREQANKGDYWVSPQQIEAKQWEWMKIYRVWEANRKVFIYPENWLEPEWRDDRSPFFKELEAELIQNDITAFSVESAFRNYLGKLDAVSSLDVVGVYHDKTSNLLHVVARTHGIAPQYFYRNRNAYGRWSAWESLPIDAKMAGENDNQGAHILPYVWKGRLFIFWLEFLERSVLPPTNVTAQDGSIGSLSSSDAKKQWMVYLSFVEYRDDKWLPKQVSREAMISYPFKDKNPEYNPHTYRPVISESDGRLWIELNSFGPSPVIQKQKKGAFETVIDTSAGAFVLTNPQAEIKVAFLPSLFKIYDSFNKNKKTPKYLNYFMGRRRNPDSGSDLTLRNEVYLTKGQRSPFTLFFDHATAPSVVEDQATIPFFCRDEKRHFFVETKDITLPILILQEPEKAPFLPYAEALQGGVAKRIKIATTSISASQSTSYQTSVMTQQTSNNIGVASKMSSSTALYAPAVQTAPAMGGSGVSISAEVYAKFKVKFETTKGLSFQNFYHPYTEVFIDRLNRFGVADLLSLDTSLADDKGDAFRAEYAPDERLVAKATHPAVKVDFGENDAYGLYNWELFFHAPLYIATRLSKGGKYAEAMQWYHYIFNPMTAEKPDENNTHFWQVPPFKIDAKESIESFFRRLAKGEATTAESDKIAEWRNNPFKPHLIARGRPVAYMKHVVMKYVENLLSWGDDLFRRDTMESINEATQIYIIAAHILGKRPERIPKRGEVAAETYASLRGRLDAFGNALVTLENLFPYASSVPLSSGAASAAQGSLLGVGTALYFCIPHNSKLLTYWDTVEDRLFKIRHCMNIDGVERKLALFDPPIDPAALVAAAASGVSLGSVLADLFSPSPMYRFSFLLKKALEITQEVREYGHFLIKILEKKDAATLALMQANHATSILKLTEDIRTWHLQESRAYRDTLYKNREMVLEKLQHHLDLMDIKLGSEGVSVPKPPQYNSGKKPTKDDELTPFTIVEGKEMLKTAASKQAPVASGEAGTIMNQAEKLVQDIRETIQTIKTMIAIGEAVGGAISAIPQFDVAAKPFGVGAGTNIGGQQFSRIIEFANKVKDVIAAFKSLEGEKSGTTAQMIRREQSWSLEGKLAVREIVQIDRQILAAEIRIAIAERELAAHQLQMQQAEEVELFLKNRFTNTEQYTWLKERLFAAHKTAYQLAYDLAKTAERAYRTETGAVTSNFIQFGYFDGSHQGLTAGEQLTVALRQLEKAYLDAQKRRFELVKNISLAKINPAALAQLKATGTCEFDVTERLLDLDFAGHYYRSIKTVALSMTTGADATTTIGATVRLLSNSVRINTTGATYERNNDDGVPTDDDRFIENNIPFKAIAVSHAKNDSGLFELNFEDDRYLPFEGAGAISRWRIELPGPAALRQFDYATIGDVILHVRYTALEDAGAFKSRVITYLQA